MRKRHGVSDRQHVKIDFNWINYYNTNCANIPEKEGFLQHAQESKQYLTFSVQSHSEEQFPTPSFLPLPRSGTVYR